MTISVPNPTPRYTFKEPRLVAADTSQPGDCPAWCDVPLDGVEHETAYAGGPVRHVGRVTSFHPSREDDVRVKVGASHWEDRNDWDGLKNHGTTQITLEVRDACFGSRPIVAGLTLDEARFLVASLTALVTTLSGREVWGDWDEVHASAATNWQIEEGATPERA